MAIFRDLGCIQIYPIRAVERTQYLVLWSRLGNYDPAHLERLLWQERQLFEYWAHAASIVLTEDYPLHQAQMRRFAGGEGGWDERVRTWLTENQSFRQHILARLREEGPLAAQQLEDLTVAPWTSSGWTNERNVGRMLGFLWEQGEIMVAERQGLKKKWGLTEHHFPEWIDHSPWAEDEVVRQAAQKSLRALGVATLKHINNHFIRGRYPNLKNVLNELVIEGVIVPVIIKDEQTTWPNQWYIHVEDIDLVQQLATGVAWQPRTILLSPFDNLICDRERTELMWDFYFRIEIYVPPAKRQYGYYVLPILQGEQLIGRLDPRMNRKTGQLHLNALYLEPHAPQDSATRQAVTAALTSLADFLGAKEIIYHSAVPDAWR
jgi:uncharacterized protein YcaQ